MRINSRSNDYRHPIEVQYPSEAKDATGGVEITWTKLFGTRAEILPLRGSEFDQDGKLIAQGHFTIGMRYRSGVTEKMRVVFGSRIFEIENVANLQERNRKLVLTCREER